MVTTAALPVPAPAAPPRAIIHVDMDAFYAAVEQRDRPELRRRPVIVGGPPNSRGVVCSASYEARAFGVRSAMASAQAARLCPQAVFVTPDFPRYSAASERIHRIFHDYTELVEALSLDEAYLDVTPRCGEAAAGCFDKERAQDIAEDIRGRIRGETGLTASAGVAPNKFLAKIASDRNKPNGLCVVRPEQVAAFLKDLPVEAVPGIGPVTAKACHRHGIKLVTDFLRVPFQQLEQWFGRNAGYYLSLAHGDDQRPVCPQRERKSVGIEETFARDLDDVAEIGHELRQLAFGLAERLRHNLVRGRTVTLKVKYRDFRVVTRSRTLAQAVDSADALYSVAVALIAATEIGRTPVRLLGLSCSHLDDTGGAQLELDFGGW